MALLAHGLGRPKISAGGATVVVRGDGSRDRKTAASWGPFHFGRVSLDVGCRVLPAAGAALWSAPTAALSPLGLFSLPGIGFLHWSPRSLIGELSVLREFYVPSLFFFYSTDYQ